MGHSPGGDRGGLHGRCAVAEDAAKVVALRSRALRPAGQRGGWSRCRCRGRSLAGKRIELMATGCRSRPSTARASTSLSGDLQTLEEISAELARRRAFAPHRSPPTAPATLPRSTSSKGACSTHLAPIAPRETTVPFHSTVSGEQTDGADLDPGYWYRNLRQAVLLEPAVLALLEQGSGRLHRDRPPPGPRLPGPGNDRRGRSRQAGDPASPLCAATKAGPIASSPPSPRPTPPG